MLTLKKIAITGGLSCGKSSACHFFKEYGSYTVSADKIVHQLLISNTKLIRDTINLLGSDILVDDQIDRSRIAKIVFNDFQKLYSFEQLIHPLVFEESERQYQQATREQMFPLFVEEIPLLFESQGNRSFDEIIVVTSDIEPCQDRFIKKTGNTVEEFEKRTKRLMSQEEKARRASILIQNNGTLSDLQNNVKKIYFNLIKHNH